MSIPSVNYGSGFVENADSVRVICHIGDGPERVAALARWVASSNKWSIFPLKWDPVRFVTTSGSKPCNYILAPNGTVGFGYGDYHEEQVDVSDAGPRSRGPLRDIRIIGSSIYAAGMSRQVYRRDSTGFWQRADAGIVTQRGEIKICGISSIDGTSEVDLWTVGFLGEIWHFIEGHWRQMESPTNLLLHRVLVVDKMRVFATGQRGLILEFRGDEWEVAYSAPEIGNLWGAEWFKNRLYVSSESGLFYLSNGELVPVVVNGVSSFGHLHANDGVMWSFGTGQLCWTADGTKWAQAKPLL